MGTAEELASRLGLAAKADRTRRFYTLKDKVCRIDILREAWRKVKENKGASGVDRETIADIVSKGEEQFLTELQRELQSETYRVQCVRRVFIPKRDGKMRPLGIPTVRDRVVQQAVKLVIEPIFEADFQEFSYGYRPNRSAKQASMQVYKWLNCGLTTVIDVDIESFFDHVNHNKLISFVMERITDGYVVKLIKEWLKAGVVYMSRTTTYPEEGTPQGGVISPLLANIYLNRLDTWWVEFGMDNYHTRMVRYADDAVILTSRDAQYVRDVLEGVVSELDLKLNAAKSRIVSAEEGFDFLGFHFTRTIDKRENRPVTHFSPSRDSTARFRKKVMETIPITRTHLMSEADAVRRLNKLIVGWGTYFSHSHAWRTFRSLQRFIEWKLAKFFSCRHKLKWTVRNRQTFDWFYRTLGLKLFPKITYLRT